MPITKDILRDIFYKMYLYFPKVSDELPSYSEEYSKFWRRYGLKSINAQIKFIDSNSGSIRDTYLESATSVDVKIDGDYIKGNTYEHEANPNLDINETIREIYSANPSLPVKVNEYWRNHADELFFVISMRNKIDNQSIKREMQKSLSEFNDNALRFINELIQNADDCVYKDAINRLTMCFDMENEEITITYPEEGFTYDDIIALSSINETNKMTDFDKATSTIGEKGRGFKSIFVYFKEVEIESGGYHFKYNVDEASMFQPIYMGTPENESGTKLILRLKDEIVLISEENKKRKIEAGMSELVRDVKEFYGATNPQNLYRNNSIFFTRNFTELVMVFSGETTSDVIKISNTHMIMDAIHHKKKWWENPDNSELHYCEGTMEYSSATRINNQDVEKTITSMTYHYKLCLVGLVKYLDYDIEIIKERYGNSTPKQIAAIKSSMPIIIMGISNIETSGEIDAGDGSGFNGHMYTYLPTSLNISLPFIFQMPFDLEDNRSCPKRDSAWNRYLLNNVWNPDNSIIRDWYEYAAGHELVKSIYNYLPTGENNKSKSYKLLAFYIDDKYYFDPHGGSKYASFAKDQINMFNQKNAEKARELFNCISIFQTKDNDEYVNIDHLSILDKTLALFDSVDGNIYWKHYKKLYPDMCRFIFDAGDERSNHVIAFQKYICHSAVLLNWKDVIGNINVHESISREINECGKNKNFGLLKQFSKQFISQDTWFSAYNIKTINELTKDNIDSIKKYGSGLLCFELIFLDSRNKLWIKYDYSKNPFPILWCVSDSKYKSHRIVKDDDKKNGYIRVAIIDKTEDIYKNSIIGELANHSIETIEEILLCIEKWTDKRVSPEDKLQIAGAYYLSTATDKANELIYHMSSMFNAVTDINDPRVINCPKLFKEDVEKCIEWERIRFSAWKVSGKRGNYELNLDYISESIAEIINPASGTIVSCDDRHVSFFESIKGRLLSEEEKSIGLDKFNKTYLNCVVNPDYFKWLPNRNFLKFSTSGYLILKSEEFLSDACDSETVLTTDFIKNVRARYSQIKANKYNTGSLGRNIGTIKAIQAYQIFSLIDNNNYREVVGKEGDICNELFQNVNDFISPETEVSISIESYDNSLTLVYEESAHVETIKGREEEKHGFLPSDILSLISIGNSTKDEKGDLYTGNKGIGFKNIYKVFDQVYVDSNGFRFFLDDSFSIDPEKLFEELISAKVSNIYNDKACKVETILENMCDNGDAYDEKGRRKRFPIIQVSKSEIDKSIYYRNNKRLSDGKEITDSLTAYKFRFRSDDKIVIIKNQLRGSYIQWLFAKNKELEDFKQVDFSISDHNMLPLFLHNISRIKCYIDGNEAVYSTYPICNEDLSVDSRWIESDKFYSNRGYMSGLNLLEIKSSRYENKKNTESDGTFSHVEVRFIKNPVLTTKKNEKITTKDGRLYISLPTEIDTGGAVHINIPALEAKANRREIFTYSFDKTNEGAWNQSIAEKAFGIRGVFEELFNSFTEKYIEEVANYAFLYIPIAIFDRFSSGFPSFRSCLFELNYIPCITKNGLRMRSLNYVKANAQRVYKLNKCMRSWFALMDPTFERFYQQNNSDVEFIDIIDENRWGLIDELKNKRDSLNPSTSTYSYHDFFEYVAKYWMGYYTQLDSAYKKQCDKSFSNRINLITAKTGIKEHYSKWQKWKKIYKESMAGKNKDSYISNLVTSVCFDCSDYSNAFYFTPKDIKEILGNDKIEIPQSIVGQYKKFLIREGYFDFMHYYELLKREIISIDVPEEETTAIQIGELYALAINTGGTSRNELMAIEVNDKDILLCVYKCFEVNSLEDLRSEIPILLMNNTFQKADEREFFVELPKDLFEDNSLKLTRDKAYDSLLDAWIEKGVIVSKANIAQADNIYELYQLDTELYELLPTMADSKLFLELLLDLFRANKKRTEVLVNSVLQYWRERIINGKNKRDYFELYIETLSSVVSIYDRIDIEEPEIEYDIECLNSKKLVSTCNKLSDNRSGDIFRIALGKDKYEANPVLYWNEIDMSLTTEQRKTVASFYYDDEIETDEDMNGGIEQFLEHIYMCSDNVSIITHYPSSQYLTVFVNKKPSFVLFKDYTESLISLLKEVFGFSLGSSQFKPFVNLYEYNSLLPIGSQEEYEFVRKDVFDLFESARDENDVQKLKMQLMSLQYQLPDNKLIRGYGMNCPLINSNNIIEQSSLQIFESAVFGFHIAITLYGSKEAKDVVLKYASKMVVRIANKKTKKKKECIPEAFSFCNGNYAFDGKELVLRGADIEKEKLMVVNILEYLIKLLDDITNKLIFEIEMISNKGAKKKEILRLDLTHCHRAIMIYELTKAKEHILFEDIDR